MKIIIEVTLPEGEGAKQIFTIEPDVQESKVVLQFEKPYCIFKTFIKTISNNEFKLLFGNISSLDFPTIYKEPLADEEHDNWSVKCTITNEKAEVSVLMCSPRKDSSCPVTTKLLEECEKIFDLFENIEVKKLKVRYDKMSEKKVNYKVRYMGEECWLLRNNVAYKCVAELYDSKGNLDSVAIDTEFPIDPFKLHINEVLKLTPKTEKELEESNVQIKNLSPDEEQKND